MITKKHLRNDSKQVVKHLTQMKFNLLTVLIFLMIACQEKKKENINSDNKPENEIEVKQVEKSKNETIELEKIEIGYDTISVFPKDTVINRWNLTFKQIGITEFKKLSKKQILTSFDQDDTRGFLTNKDSCYYLTLHTKEKDTLCDLDDGEYFEKYSLKGFSQKTNTLIFDWKNWEEAHSILINLNENKHWILCPEYSVSPNNNRLVTFSNYIDNPIYEENELFIYDLSKNSVNQICRFSDESYGVFKANWIDVNTIIIELKQVDFESFKAKESYFFEIEINSMSNTSNN